jgi:hypothetical protein
VIASIGDGLTESHRHRLAGAEYDARESKGCRYPPGARVGAEIPRFGDAGSPSGRIDWALTPAGRYCLRPWPDTPWTNLSRATYSPALPAHVEAIGATPHSAGSGSGGVQQSLFPLSPQSQPFRRLSSAAQLGDARIGLLCVLVGVPIWISFVTSGPALASFVRHLRLPLARERTAVVGAIFVGVLISCGGQYLAGVFARAEISPRFSALFSGPAGQKFRETAPVVVAIVWGCDTALFFLLGGGLALRTYFREQRSWENAQYAREVDQLRRQKDEADLRLTALQAQVEPHFLFNTLASIHSLIRTATGLACAGLAVWFAAKVFKVGLLMQGKPPSFGTLMKWARTGVIAHASRAPGRPLCRSSLRRSGWLSTSRGRRSVAGTPRCTSMTAIPFQSTR